MSGKRHVLTKNRTGKPEITLSKRSREQQQSNCRFNIYTIHPSSTALVVAFVALRVLQNKKNLKFFCCVIYLSRPLRKHMFNLCYLEGFQMVMVCVLWLVLFDPFILFLCFKVCCPFVACDLSIFGYNRLVSFEHFSALYYCCHLKE